ncbi:retrotransposon protein, putative, ty1-copia subclass [Tanacetum coccineum]
MDGNVHIYKARLVAKGYTQTYMVDYEETFSPVADIRAIRILISIVAFYDYEIWQMDVKIAFLNGYLDEDIYMVQPEGFVDPKHPRKVCKLQRSIYELKQALRSWNKRFDEEIKSFEDNNFRTDGVIIMGNHIPSLQSVKNYLEKYFSKKDLGEAAFILGIKIYRDRSKRLIGLSQNAYMDKILKRYKMDNSKRSTIPMQERLDLNKSQGAQTPKEINRKLHWTAVKNILKYLRNTKDMFLAYGGNPSTELRVECYCDAGFETDIDDTKSQTGYVFVLNGGAMDWKSSKQRLGIIPTINEPLNMYYDNLATIHYANEPGVQKDARHYHRRYHYVRECVERGEIRILKVHTDNNLDDPFTKALSNRKLTQHARSMGLRPASSFMKGNPLPKTKKRKGKSKSSNSGQFTGPSVKHNVRYEPKATTSAPKKGTTYVGYTSQSTPMLKTTSNSSKKDNLTMSNSFSALNEEEEKDEEEDVENVYDESANLIQNTKAGGSSSFTAAAG